MIHARFSRYDDVSVPDLPRLNPQIQNHTNSSLKRSLNVKPLEVKSYWWYVKVNSNGYISYASIEICFMIGQL